MYPYAYQQAAYSGSVTQVSGIEGARAFQMMPNSSAALFSSTEDVFYFKTTDGAGYPTVRAYRFEEVPADGVRADVATKGELEEVREAVARVEQSVREVAAAIAGQQHSEPGSGGEGKPAGGLRPDDAV